MAELVKASVTVESVTRNFLLALISGASCTVDECLAGIEAGVESVKRIAEGDLKVVKEDRK
ncbi:hypothetical protein [Maridesulfovibrio sp.]|uniref:hypothetical protein n=1 Tax=Maridesulfovibrio sp. TaxID=2795000 RepID=UPI002AA90487|nr:hypothetical protein [Maridesulfovibrio sp.]